MLILDLKVDFEPLGLQQNVAFVPEVKENAFWIFSFWVRPGEALMKVSEETPSVQGRYVALPEAKDA